MFAVKLMILFACFSWSQCKLNKYCSVCIDHTMCKYQGIGEECKGDGESGVSETDKSEIVDLHNWLRGKVASGAEERGVNGGQPSGANILKMEWDDELATVAQRWADQCLFKHDTCRNDVRWKVGQNIYWAWKYPYHQVNWTEAILSWYNEVSFFNPKRINPYRFQSATGHYTQILWHDTSAIGCGRKDYGPNKLYVCNYGPAGNWINQKMYEVGAACSKCPKNYVCESFLCAPRKSTEDVEKPPTSNPNIIQNPSEKDEGNKTEILEVLKPPAENAKEIYTKEEENLCKNQNQTQQSQAENNQIIRALNGDQTKDQENQEVTTNSIEENIIVLDAEIKRKIKEIMKQIENLVKFAIKKSKTKY